MWPEHNYTSISQALIELKCACCNERLYIVELDEQFIFVIYRNRTVFVPTLSLNNDHVVNKYACEVIIQRKAHPRLTQNCCHYNAFKNMSSL